MRTQLMYCWDCLWSGPEDQAKRNKHEEYLCPECGEYVCEEPENKPEVDTFSDADPGL